MQKMVSDARKLMPSRARAALVLLIFLLASPGAAYANTGVWSPLNVAFYSTVFTSLMVCMLINFAIKNPAGIKYAIMFLLGLGFLWASDGGLAAMGLSDQNLTSTIGTLGMIVVAFGFHTAVNAFDPKRNMKLWRRFFHALAFASLALIPIIWIASSPLILYAGVALFLVSLFSHGVSTSTWKHHDDTQQSMPIVAAALGFILVAGITASLLTGYGRGFLLSWNAMKAVLAIVMIPTLSAVVFALADVRSSRDDALEDAIEAARKDARTSASLFEMEKQYARVRENASARSRQLSSASHDIRQPLASMRAELDALRNDAPADNISRLDRVLDHLEALTHSLSASGRAPVDAGLHGEVDVERVEINLLFDTLDRLFQAEAAHAEVTLTFERSPHAVDGPPLILIRMLSNLLSNAIQHSGASEVTVRSEAVGKACLISLTDNGAGFAGGKIDWAMASGAKGTTSEGSGLGLSIVQQLSEAYNLPLSSETAMDAGTTFVIAIPLD